MSTRVTPEDWPELYPVPRENYKSFGETDTGPCWFPCDLSPVHGPAVIMLQTKDHRAIALCESCLLMVRDDGEAN